MWDGKVDDSIVSVGKLVGFLEGIVIGLTVSVGKLVGTVEGTVVGLIDNVGLMELADVLLVGL
jgi:hypothetical protein